MFQRAAFFHLLFIIIGFAPFSFGQIVTTIAGIQDNIGSKNDLPLNSTFNNPHGVEVDRNGIIYVADRYNHLIRKVDLNGVVTTLAGSGLPGSDDGQGTAASFKEPWGLTVDSLGYVYVADTKNNKIRKISPNGLVTTIAGTGTFGIKDATNPLQATFGNPLGIAVDKAGNLFIGDHLTNLIRKITPLGVVSTLAGDRNYPNNFGLVDGIGQTAKFYRPYGVEVDRQGNVYVADEWNHAIRKITPFGEVTTLGGNGVKGSVNGSKLISAFNYPWDVALDSVGNVYVADGYNYVIRKINTSLEASTFAGSMGKSGSNDGAANTASFNGATSVSMSVDNRYMVVGDAYNQLLRMITIPVPIASPVISFENTPSEDSITICEGEDISTIIQGTYDFYGIYVDGNKIASTASKTVVISNFYLKQGRHVIDVRGQKLGYAETKSNTLIIKVLKNSSFKINQQKPTHLCVGDSVILSTSDNSIVTWNTKVNSKSITVRKSGSYYITGVEGQCLSPQDTVRLVFNNLPISTITKEEKTNYYEGDTVQLTASSSISYQWSNDSTRQINLVTKTGKYAVETTNEFGCSSISDSMYIYFKPIPQNVTILSLKGIKFCSGDSLPLLASYSKNIQWKKNGSFINAFDSILFVKEPGIYSFECQLDVNKKLISNQLNITESKLPVAEFTYYLAKETNNYAIVQFNATKIENEKSYNWSLGNSMISTISNPTYTFTETGNYTIHMEAVTNDGCSSITTKNISIQLTNELFVPTAFTPNNDGVNDRIKLLGIPASTKLSFMIFNEWGQLVYSSTSAADSWDGTYKGEPSNAGNYSYLLTITLNGVEQSLKGIITLIK